MIKRTGLAAVLVGIVSTAVMALPQVAVLEAVIPEDMDASVAIPITDKISEALVNSRKYTVLDREHVTQVLQEKEFQLSGLVKTEEIRKVGEYLGSDFVAVARAAKVGETYFISARLIDVKTGAIAAQTSVERQGSIDVLISVASEVGRRLAGGVVEKVAEERFEAPVTSRPRVPAPPPPPPQPAPAPQAQPETAAAAPPVFVGAKGGVNLADVYGDSDWSDTTPGMRWVAGAYMSARMDEAGVELDLLWAQKGYDYEFYDGTNLDDAYNKWTFNYVDVAALGKLYLDKKAPLYLAAGLSVGFYVGGTVTVEYDTKTYLDDEADLDDVRDVNVFDFAGLLGMGVDIPLGPKGLLNLEMRLGMSLLTWWGGTGDATPKHLLLTFMGGFGFAP